jgi:hypothetical protein
MYMNQRKRLWVLFTLIATLAIALAFAGQGQQADKQPEASATDDSRLSLYTITDPVTGKKRRLAVSELEALGLPDPLARHDHDLTETVHADGTSSIGLRGGYQHAVMVKRAPDGSLVTTCVDSAEAAEAFLNQPVRKAPEVSRDR